MGGKLAGQSVPSSVPLRELWYDARTYGWRCYFALVWGVLSRLLVAAYVLAVVGIIIAGLMNPELGT